MITFSKKGARKNLYFPPNIESTLRHIACVRPDFALKQNSGNIPEGVVI